MAHRRQGDILIVEVDTLPDEAHPLPVDSRGIVLAEGEATGHCHAVKELDVQWIEDTRTRARYLASDKPFEVEHQEHKALPAKGTVRVLRQFEYTPGELRNVAD